MDFRLGIIGAFQKQFDPDSSHMATGTGSGANYRSPLLLHDETSVVLEKQKRDSFLGLLVVIVGSLVFASCVTLNREPFITNIDVLNLIFSQSLVSTLLSGLYFVFTKRSLWSTNKSIWHWMFIIVHPSVVFSLLFSSSFLQSENTTTDSICMFYFLVFPIVGGLFALRCMNEQLTCSYPLIVIANAVGFFFMFPPGEFIFDPSIHTYPQGHILFIISIFISILWLGAVRKANMNTFRIVFWGSMSTTLITATALLAADKWTIEYSDPALAFGVSTLVLVGLLCLAESATLLPVSHVCVLSFLFPLAQCFVRWFVLRLPSPPLSYFGASILTLTLIITSQCLPETKSTVHSVDWVDDRQDFTPNYRMIGIENLKLDTDISTGSLSTPHAKFGDSDLSLHYQ